MVYGENLNWLRHIIYPLGFSGGYLCTWSTTSIICTRSSVNQCPSWGDMENIANYCTFNYGACKGFWLIYKFYITVNDWSYISCSNNQTLAKSGWWTHHATQTGNGFKTFSFKAMSFIFSMCGKKGYCTYWHKGVKYAPSITNRVLWHLCWNLTTSLRVPCLHT